MHYIHTLAKSHIIIHEWVINELYKISMLLQQIYHWIDNTSDEIIGFNFLVTADIWLMTSYKKYMIK